MSPTPPSTPGWGRLLNAALEIGAVLHDQSPTPRRHDLTEGRHRRQWPALWNTIDELMRSIDALNNEAEGVERTPTPRPTIAEREALARITDRTRQERETP